MYRCCKILTFVAVAVLCTDTRAEQFDEQTVVQSTELGIDVVDYLKTIADAKFDLAQAVFDRQRQRVDALTELYAQGHSTFRERTIAEIELAKLKAELAGAKTFCAYVAKTAAAAVSEDAVNQDAVNEDTDEADRSTTVLLNVPGLAEDPQMNLLSTIAVQVPRDDELVTKALQVAGVRAAPRHSARLQAWDGLCERLRKIQDGSAALQNELAIALLNKQQAAAESRIAALSDWMIQVCRPMGSFSLDGVEIESIEQLMTATKQEADRLNHVVMRDAVNAQVGFIAEWNRRVAIAAQKGASPPSELPMLNRMMATTQDRGEYANEMLELIAAANQIDRNGGANFVTAAQNSLHPQLAISHVQLANIRDASIERLLDAADFVQAAQDSLARVSKAYHNLVPLAQKDSYFSGEVIRTKLSLQVAESSLENALFQHEQRQLEHEYIVARIDPSSDQEWLHPLTNLFLLRSDSHAEQNLEQARLDKEQWLVDGLNRLYQDGSATWKELTAAKVRLAEWQDLAARAAAGREAAAVVAQLLSSPTAKLGREKKTLAFSK